MTRMLLKRFGQGILVIVVLQTITFFLVRQLPGNPFLGERKLPQHIMDQLNNLYGLDQSAWVQYLNYWKGIILHGDFGPSLIREGVQVSDIIAQAFPVSLWLGVLGMLIAVLAGIPAGMLAAYWRNRWPDALIMLLAMAGICIPAFVIAPVLGITLGMHIPGLSVAGWDDALCAVLPALTLGLVNAAYIARLTRGGMAEGLSILAEVRDTTGVPVLTDIHTAEQAAPVAEVADYLQTPAFLCRQTDLIVAAASQGKPVNIKKGQFLAPWEMENVLKKAASTGNDRISLCERGTSFGYGNLVVDMRGLEIMKRFAPVVYDATHSVQLPGAQGSCSGGQREFVPTLARAAAAVGVAGIFMEVHPDPDKAPCDGPNMLAIKDLPKFLECIRSFDRTAKEFA